MRKRYDWDDPRLTAYVLGELSDRERAEVEAELANNAAARKVVAEIREMADILTEELGQEAVPALTPEQRAAILGWSGGRVAPRFNRFFVLVASATACLLAFAGVVYRTHVLQERSKAPELAMLAEEAGRAGGNVPPPSPALETDRLASKEKSGQLNGVTEADRLNVRGEPTAHGVEESPTADVHFYAWKGGTAEKLAEREEVKAGVERALVSSKPVDSEKAGEVLLDKLDLSDARGRPTDAVGGRVSEPALPEEDAVERLELAMATPESAAKGEGARELDRQKLTNLGYVGGDAVPVAGQKKAETFVQRRAELLASAKEPAAPLGDSPVRDKLFHSQRSGGVQRDRSTSRLSTGVAGYGQYAEGARPTTLARRDSDEEPMEGRYFHEIPQEDERVHRGRRERSSAETYEYIVDNPFRRVADAPLSTFSIDVDTASYTNIRRFLTRGHLPPKQAVRIEEMVNYFTYDYPQPRGKTPFSVNVEVAGCPWEAEHKLARVGIKGKDIVMDDRPAANLVFLLDVSGSMKDQNKLPLLKSGMELLTKKLARNDQVAIVTYRDDAHRVLESTPAAKKQAILKAIRALHASGSTNGAAGIEMAYDIAADNFVKDGINRVILATDGDFNVGVTERSELIDLIEERAKTGVFLTVLGFGTGNLKDANLEALADKGNGHYAYIDSFNEARKVLMEQVGGTFFTIAKDVKIQIEFNPGKVDAYRLIGYENRMLADRDFADDRKDAGEIGAGHTVTALYEVVPRGKGGMLPGVDQLKYQQPPDLPDTVVKSDDLMNVRLRYKAPDGDTSTMVESPVGDSKAGIEQASTEFRFAAAVAGFGMLLRDSDYMSDTSFDLVLKLARGGKGVDEEGHRAEFINLVKTAQALKTE